MKKRLLLTIAFAVWCGATLLAQSPAQPLPESALQAQKLTGTWQGSLKAGQRDLRVVFKISLEDTKLKAVMYSIDQGGEWPASGVTHDGSAIKIAVAAVRGNYAGKLSSDGKVVRGTWNQGAPLPLNLARATPETAWALPNPPPPMPMSADANPVFEVATIKPSQYARGVSLQLNPSGLFTTAGTSLSDLVKFAYDLHPRQIVGAPAWFETEKYDVTGKPDKPGRPNLAQLKAMLQKLLADRFQLTLHRDQRELSVYAIKVTKPGPKLTRNDSDPNGLPGGRGIGAGSLDLSNITMAEFATMLQSAGNTFDRPVVDQTGLGPARYDIVLRWMPDSSQPQLGDPEPNAQRRADNADAPPDLFTAFQQQLGLKLEPTKAPVEVLVVDQVKKPSEN